MLVNIVLQEEIGSKQLLSFNFVPSLSAVESDGFGVLLWPADETRSNLNIEEHLSHLWKWPSVLVIYHIVDLNEVIIINVFAQTELKLLVKNIPQLHLWLQIWPILDLMSLFFMSNEHGESDGSQNFFDLVVWRAVMWAFNDFNLERAPVVLVGVGVHHFVVLAIWTNVWADAVLLQNVDEEFLFQIFKISLIAVSKWALVVFLNGPFSLLEFQNWAEIFVQFRQIEFAVFKQFGIFL